MPIRASLATAMIVAAWYAPALRWVVKVQRFDNQGVREEDRAVSYELAH